MDLGDNQLTGTIPSELGNLANLERLHLASNQLTGCIPAALRDVGDDNPDNDPDHDLSELGLPLFCDLLLSGLSVSPRSLDPAFDPNHPNYEAFDGPALVTVTASTEHDATIRIVIRDERGGEGVVPDADDSLAGYQVDLDSGVVAIFVLVVSQDGVASTYTTWVRAVSPCVAGGSVPDVANSGLVSDCETLLGLRDTLAGTAVLNWSADRPITVWDGVTVEGTPERVTRLRLINRGLTGTVPPELGSLANLEGLFLNNNQLTGQIPPELGSLASLEWLYLSNNQLTGVLPQNLTMLTALFSFIFYNNPGLCASVDAAFQSWIGSIDTVVGSSCAPSDSPEDRAALVALYRGTDGANWTNNAKWLSNRPIRDWHGVISDADGRVTHLVLYRNQLTGTIPVELSSLSNLEELYLNINQLSGKIPAELGDLANLERLHLFSNELSGSIPPELGSLSNLEVLYLSNNQLSGKIPAELGDLANLERLYLFSNELSGSIPPELGSLSNLEVLHLNNNQLTGWIPAGLGNLSNLNLLWLADNQLTGCVPYGLRDVARNDFEGLGLPICDPPADDCTNGIAVADATNNPGLVSDCEALIVARDTLAGTVTLDWSEDTPISEWEGVTVGDFGNSRRVVVLDLRNKGLTGTIPPQLAQLTALSSLGLFTMDYVCDNDGCRDVEARLWNRLTGSIPPELGDLSNLRWLSLDGNQLSGTIPAELGDLSNLMNLILDGNQLSGTIPAELGDLSNLMNLILDGNQLSGTIPAELGDLTNLTWLDLGANQLSGSIPTELGDLTNLTWLNLAGNQLSGSIPSELGGLTNLDSLFLFSNQLSGEIPSELGDLVNLDRLDLSYNRLTGEIPTELGDLSNLELLRLSGNELTGCVPYGLRDVGENDFEALGLPFCEQVPLVSMSTADAPMVRLRTAISVTATFSEPVSGFAVGDITVVNGSAGNFVGSDGDSEFTFDVIPNAVGVVTVDIAAGVAQDSDGNGNTAATLLKLGLPYDDDHDGCIELPEARTAIGDYFAPPIGSRLSLEEARKAIGLYFECLSRQSQ